MKTEEEFDLCYEDELGYCNVKLVALGGDGANTIGKLLFKIAVDKLDLDGAFDAQYGSEKKGTPTDVSIRLCKLGRPVRTSGTLSTPHILAIMREQLIEPMRLNVGLQPKATVIVNTTENPAAIRDRLQLADGKIICLDATRIAAEARSRINIPVFGLLIQVLGFPDQAAREMLSATWPKVSEANLKAYEGITSAQFQDFPYDGKYKHLPYSKPQGGVIGYLTQRPGGVLINALNSSYGKTHGASRTGQMPLFNPDACIHCVKCYYACSDPGSIVFANGKMMGIDYDYCKGCNRCVMVCPDTKNGKALTKVLEADYAEVVLANEAASYKNIRKAS